MGLWDQLRCTCYGIGRFKYYESSGRLKNRGVGGPSLGRGLLWEGSSLAGVGHWSHVHGLWEARESPNQEN